MRQEDAAKGHQRREKAMDRRNQRQRVVWKEGSVRAVGKKGRREEPLGQGTIGGEIVVTAVAVASGAAAAAVAGAEIAVSAAAAVGVVVAADERMNAVVATLAGECMYEMR